MAREPTHREPIAGDEMRRFWDERAREDAYYFVDSRLDYRRPDHDRFWAAGEEAVETLLSLVSRQLSAHDVVVEIGCGLGRLTRAIASRVDRVEAIDVSSEMIERGRALNPQLTNVEWRVGSGTDLAPLGDGTASVCMSHVVFQHIPDPAITMGYISEIGRVLGEDGWAVCVVSNDPKIHHARLSGRERLHALLGRAPRGREHPSWVGSSVDLDQLQLTAEEAGMCVSHIEGAGSLYCTVLLTKIGSPEQFPV